MDGEWSSEQQHRSIRKKDFQRLGSGWEFFPSRTIHAYTERAEGAFRDMFEHVLERLESGAADITPYELGPPRDEAIRLIDRLQRLASGKPG